MPPEHSADPDHEPKRPWPRGDPAVSSDASLLVDAHRARTALTVIRLQAHMLARIISGLEVPNGQRARLLAGLARIEAAVDEVMSPMESPPPAHPDDESGRAPQDATS